MTRCGESVAAFSANPALRHLFARLVQSRRLNQSITHLGKNEAQTEDDEEEQDEFAEGVGVNTAVYPPSRQ